MSRELVHFYHVWPAGDWKKIAEDHAHALDKAEFPKDSRYAYVQLGECNEMFLHGLGFQTQASYHIEEEADTLQELWNWVQEYEGDVLYAHTKGTFNVSALRDAWRAAMTTEVVSEWQHLRSQLHAYRYDAAGICWQQRQADWAPGFFAGNFWMAKSEYLRLLPNPESSISNRFGGERWIGINDPRVIDNLPGRPSMELFKHYVKE